MEAKYEIKKTLAVLPAKEGDLYHMEVNLISWYGKDPKIDIRRWTNDRSKMTKGISLTKEEFQQIINEAGGKLDGINI